MRTKLNTFSLMVIVSLFFCGGLSAQTPVDFGQFSTHTISTPGEIDRYEFSASAGVNYIVRMSDLFTTALRPEIQVHDPDGSPVKGDWDETTAEVSFAAEKDGKYSIRATDQNDQNTGAYGLIVQRSKQPGNARAAEFGRFHLDSITTVGDFHSYTFDTEAGMRCIVRMADLAGTDFRPRIYVFGPDGRQVGGDWDDLTAEDVFTAEKSGTHTVWVMDYYGYYTGEYGLIVQRSQQPGNARSAEYGRFHLDSISTVGNFHSYTFDVEAGLECIVRMADVAGTDFRPRIYVFGPDGRQVGSDWDDLTAEDVFTAEKSGTHTVWVMDYYGYYTGNYCFVVQRSRRPGNARALTSEGTVVDTIAAAGKLHTYTFGVDAGHEVTVRMSDRSNTDFSPLFYVFDPDGQLIGSRWNYTDIELVFTTAKSGSYTVWVMDYTGYYTGHYDFSVNGPIQTENPLVLEFGRMHLDAISSAGMLHTYTFDVTAGWEYIIRMADRSNSDFTPRIEVLDSDGLSIGSHWDNICAEVVFPAPKSGTYTVRATDYSSGYTGNYSIVVQRSRLPGNARTVIFGRNYVNTIAAVGGLDIYTFDIDAGKECTVRMTDRSNTDLTPRIYVFDPDGQRIDSRWNISEVELVFNTIKSGSYTVWVMDDKGYYTGQYDFIVEVSNQTGNPGVLEFGHMQLDVISGAEMRHTYTFDVTAGWKYIIRMADRSNSDFTPRIEVLDSDGLSIGSDWDNICAEVVFLAPKSGTYTVRAMDNGGVDTGNFAIIVQRSRQPGNARTAEFGLDEFDWLEDTGIIRTYTFDLAAGLWCIVRMADRSATDLAPSIFVFGPDGQEIDWKTDQINAEVIFETVKSGTYTLWCMDEGGDDTGKYGIVVQRSKNPGNAGALEIGRGVVDAIAATGALHSYTFDLNAGQGCVVRMTDRTETDFEPSIVVFDPDGNRIDRKSGQTIAEVLFQSEKTGTYTVWVMDSSGAYTGEYEIVVDIAVPVAESLEYSQLNIDVVPNPAFDQAAIQFALERPQHLTCQIFNSNGILVQTLTEHALFDAGAHTITWDGKSRDGHAVVNGMYFVKISSGLFNVAEGVLVKRD